MTKQYIITVCKEVGELLLTSHNAKAKVRVRVRVRVGLGLELIIASHETS